MSWLKRTFEWYLGVPPVEPGQGTAWRFEWSSPVPDVLPNWVAVLVLLAGVAAVVLVYRADAARVPFRRRLLLLGLRLGVLLLLLVLLTRMRLSIERTGLPTIVVLVDDSASTGIEDRYDDDVAGRIRELLAEADLDDELVRHDIGRAVLLAGDGQLLRELTEHHKLRVYRFGSGIASIGEYLGGDDLDELLAGIRDLRGDGTATRPGACVREVLDEFRGNPPTAIVVLTDGISTTGDEDRLSVAAELARERVVPLFVVGLGREQPARDLQLYDLLVDEVAFVGDPITFAAKLKAAGVEADEVELVLRDETTGDVLVRRSVPVPEEGVAAPVEIVYAPPKEGRFQYRLSVEPMPHETNVENNSESRTIVVREGKLKVLYVEGVPRYEFKYAKHVLERERTIELHTVLQDADLEYATDDATAIDHVPVRRDELATYDVVLFGDVDPGQLGPAVLENLRAYVEEDGGGVLFVAGRFFNPLAYRGTPLESLFPIEFDTAAAPDPAANQPDGFRPRLTLAGRRGVGILRLLDTEADSVALLADLPELYWMVAAPDLRPGAIVLAERPAPGGVGTALPVVALQQFGEGKVLFQSTDDLWLWRKFTGDSLYGRYWVQAVRHLARNRLLGGEGKVEVTTDRRTYRQGDRATVRVRFRDESLAPKQSDGVTVMVEREGDVRRPLVLRRVPQLPGVFEGRLPPVAAGAHHLVLTQPALPGDPATWDFRVEAPDEEMRRTALDRADLVRAAERTHGRYYEPLEAAAMATDLPAGQPVRLEAREPVSLWNRPELLILFALLLLAEWLLRKRERLV